MEKKQQEIIDTSAVLFSVAGIKKTSVDLICSKCGISKKTLYQYFDHKEAIVDEIVKNALLEIKDYIKQTAPKSADAPLELIGFFYFLKTGLSVFTPIFISDLIKFYPDINMLIIKLRTAELMPFLVKNVDRGIVEGYYRESINARLTAELYFRQLDSVLGDNALNGSTKIEILNYINSFFLHGILNRAGKNILWSDITIQ